MGKKKASPTTSAVVLAVIFIQLSSDLEVGAAFASSKTKQIQPMWVGLSRHKLSAWPTDPLAEF